MRLRFILVTLMLGLMIACYPAQWFLVLWLPQYSESAVFLILLFPLCIFEGKISVLTNNYLKALRLEKTMLYINLASVFVSLAISVICAFVLNNLTLCVLSIVLISGFRCVLSELIIARKIGINVSVDILLEFVFVVIFITTGWFLRDFIAVLVYSSCYAVYLLLKRGSLREAVRLII